MAEIAYIKHLYENEGKHLKEIARITNSHYRTVKKYAYQSNWSPESPPDMKPESYPVLGAYIPIVDEWLAQDQREPRKQRHTMKMIWKRLQNEKGFTGSYQSVKKYVRKKKFLMQQTHEDQQAFPLFLDGLADFGQLLKFSAVGGFKRGLSQILVGVVANLLELHDGSQHNTLTLNCGPLTFDRIPPRTCAEVHEM